MYSHPQSPLWFTRNIRYFVYFVRELTGVFIAFYVIYFLILALRHPADWNDFLPSPAFRILSGITLAAAIFHTVTWLFVSVKIAPLPQNKAVRIAAFIFLICVWLVLSFILIQEDYLYFTF